MSPKSTSKTNPIVAGVVLVGALAIGGYVIYNAQVAGEALAEPEPVSRPEADAVAPSEPVSSPGVTKEAATAPTKAAIDAVPKAGADSRVMPEPANVAVPPKRVHFSGSKSMVMPPDADEAGHGGVVIAPLTQGNTTSDGAATANKKPGNVAPKPKRRRLHFSTSKSYQPIPDAPVPLQQKAPTPSQNSAP